MSEYNAPYNTEWLEAIVRFAEKSICKSFLYGDFLSYGRGFADELRQNNLPEIAGGEYLPVWSAISDSVKQFVSAAPDPQEASGAVLWRLLKSPYRGSEREASQYFRKERRYQRNMVGLLDMLSLSLSAKDKINALSFLNYKYTSEEYVSLYKELGNFDIGKNSETFDYEREQTVRLFYDLLDSSKKSTWKNKVSSVAVLLETIAKNASVLSGATHNGRTIDAEARAEMLALMKKSRVTFSLSCLSYFSSVAEPVNANVEVMGKPENVSAVIYLGAVLNKAETLRYSGRQNEVLKRSFQKVHSLIETRTSTSDKLIDNYSAYLSLYAAAFSGREVTVDVLENLLLQNAEQKNKNRKYESLFPELLQPEELPHYDKKNVLKVAENYGASLEKNQSFNPLFNQEMVLLLQRIISVDSYKKEEVQAVCDALRGPDGGEPYGVQTAKEIMSHYTSYRFIEDWRIPRRD